jgi:outer membrane protein
MRNIKMVKCLKVLGVFISLTSCVYATDIKIAVVNTDRILRESAPAVRAGKKLESEFAPRKKELVRLSSQLRNLQQQLEKGKLDEAARRTTERELLRLNQDFQRIQLEFNEDMTTRSNEELSTLNATVTKAIQQLAEEENIDLVLQEAVYRSKRIDITDKALKYLSDK